MLSDIKVLIWDFDGTLFRTIPALATDVRQAEYRTIMNHTGWPRAKTVEEFNTLHRTVLSATETVAQLSKIPTVEAALEGERYFDRKKYLHRDEKLVQLFEQLNRFLQFMLVNGTKRATEDALRTLGVPVKIFREIVSSEIVGENKPSEKGFLYIIHQTRLRPDQHLMIGDREAIDLVPAKKLGMKTCLVWADPNGQFSSADIVLPTVYDVYKILI